VGFALPLPLVPAFQAEANDVYATLPDEIAALFAGIERDYSLLTGFRVVF